MNTEQLIKQLGQQAKQASYALAQLSTEQKNTILLSMADALETHSKKIQAANQQDMNAGEQANLTPALLDRLKLDEQRIHAMAEGFRHIVSLADPVGTQLTSIEHHNGMHINKIRVPIGVIGVIYESRPNVTADVAALCLKTSNAVILRGGAEALHSNQAIATALLAGGQQAGLPEHAIQLVPITDREAVKYLVQMPDYLDLVIPRGGEGLIKTVMELSHVPIIKHYKGLCHVYVDAKADQDMALAICENAKVQRPGVCNAVETILVHKDIATSFIPALTQCLRQHQVDIRGDASCCEIDNQITPAQAKDWDTEYLDLIVSIKIVDSLQQAIEHINTHGSHHSDCIISADTNAQQAFSAQVDSAAVYVNASTRFTDGGEFGMGAEIGISTDKLHARGPMGLEELTTYKYVIQGTGQVR